MLSEFRCMKLRARIIIQCNWKESAVSIYAKWIHYVVRWCVLYGTVSCMYAENIKYPLGSTKWKRCALQSRINFELKMQNINSNIVHPTPSTIGPLCSQSVSSKPKTPRQRNGTCWWLSFSFNWIKLRSEILSTRQTPAHISENPKHICTHT